MKPSRIELPFDGGRLRELRWRDLPKVSTLSSDREIQQMYSPETPLTAWYWKSVLQEEDFERRDTGFVRQRYSFAIEEEQVKGIVHLAVAPYSFDYRLHSTEVSFFVGREYRGQGLAARALQAAIPFMFDFGSGKIWAMCFKENTTARRVLERTGLQKRWEGISQLRVRGREIVVYDVYHTRYDPEKRWMEHHNALKPSCAF